MMSRRIVYSSKIFLLKIVKTNVYKSACVDFTLKEG